MSSTPQGYIPDLITRFLALHEGRNATEVARQSGLNHSTISQWRRGDFPAQLQESTRRKLVDAVGELPPSAPTPRLEPRDYWRGMQDAAVIMMRTVVDIQTQIGAALNTPAEPVSPSASAIADGLEALRTLEAQQAESPKGRRKGRG